MNLSKALVEEFPLIYFTEDYRLEASPENFGYYIINADNGVVEVHADQLPQGVFSLLAMQEAYEELLGEGKDPVREYQSKKSQVALQRAQVPKGRIMH